MPQASSPRRPVRWCSRRRRVTPPTESPLLLLDQEVLVAGDYLSPCEIPSLNSDAGRAAYLASLERLEAMIRRARCVVPGHGWPLAAARAQTILAEDRRYVDGLAGAIPPRVPRHAADPAQQAQHRANLAACGRP